MTSAVGGWLSAWTVWMEVRLQAAVQTGCDLSSSTGIRLTCQLIHSATTYEAFYFEHYFIPLGFIKPHNLRQHLHLCLIKPLNIVFNFLHVRIDLNDGAIWRVICCMCCVCATHGAGQM